MKSYSVDDLRPFLEEGEQIVGNVPGAHFSHAKPVTDADEDSLVWVSATKTDKLQRIQKTPSKTVICDLSVPLDEGLLRNKCFMRVSNPRLTFIKVSNALFAPPRPRGIHPTAVVHPDARVHESSYIGPLTYLGKCTIGEDTVIYGNVYVYDNVRIGKRNIIHAGCVIGSDGFGFERDKNGVLHKFPHLGGVILEDDVELQALSHVSRGGLGDTIIRGGTKVDSCCHIAHNDDIGENNSIAAHTMFSGSVKTGKNSWIGPATAFRNSLEVGENAFIGIGSLVVKDVPENGKVMGSPAKPIEEYKKLFRLFQQLLDKNSQ